MDGIGGLIASGQIEFIAVNSDFIIALHVFICSAIIQSGVAANFVSPDARYICSTFCFLGSFHRNAQRIKPLKVSRLFSYVRQTRRNCTKIEEVIIRTYYFRLVNLFNFSYRVLYRLLLHYTVLYSFVYILYCKILVYNFPFLI